MAEKHIDEFVEKGADLEHDRWARWQKYMFSKSILNADKSVTIPAEFADRWFRQIDTKYADLPEEEKESDRKETRNYLPLINTYFIAKNSLEFVAGGLKEVADNYILKKDLEERIEKVKQKHMRGVYILEQSSIAKPMAKPIKELIEQLIQDFKDELL